MCGSIILIFSLGIGFRLATAVTKRTLKHDEGISYLAAAGQQGTYEGLIKNEQPPYGRWTSAAEWQRLLKTESFWCFRTISSDLARHDIHPPLYFWILHSWVYLFDAIPRAGILLNTLIFSLSFAGLLILYRLVSGFDWGVLPVLLLFACSPSTQEISLEARQYELLSFLAIGFSLLCYLFFFKNPTTWGRFWGWLALTLCVSAGVLTHYYFALFPLGMLALSLFFFRDLSRRKWHLLGTSFATGALLFLLSHPHFWISFQTLISKGQVTPLQSGESPLMRVDFALNTVGRFFTPIGANIAGGLILVVLAASCLKGTLSRSSSTAGNRFGFIWKPRLEFVFPIMSFWILAWIMALYIAGASPDHAMGAKYMSMAWPLIAITLVHVSQSVAVRFTQVIRGVLFSVFCLWIILYGGTHAFFERTRLRQQITVGDLLTGVDQLVSDNVARGVFPRLFFELPSDLEVFAADQEYLIEHPEIWINNLRPGAVIFSNVSYGNTLEGQERLLETLSRTREFRPIAAGFWEITR